MLCVYDTQSFYHPGQKSVTHPLNNWMLPGFARAGVVMDTVYLRDLERVDLTSYCVAVFFNTFLMKRRSALRRSAVSSPNTSRKRGALWCGTTRLPTPMAQLTTPTFRAK